jgi:acyl-coenzyme A synthetase/AMP-(fatty) acid ligase
MEMILSAGSLLSPQLSDRVRARMCPNVVSLYGSTEASMIAVASAHVLAPIPGAVGHVLPDVTVQIVGDSGKVLPPGTEGTVRICSRYSPGEYVGIPAEEASAFAEEWFYPGDIGRVTPDNLLVITGRDKAVLNVGGDKLKPEMVEQVIASFPGIEQAAVFGIPNQLGIDELWSLVVVTGKLDEHALRLHCESIIPSNFVPSRFIVTERLPRNDMGKVERQHLPEIAKIKSG